MGAFGLAFDRAFGCFGFARHARPCRLFGFAQRPGLHPGGPGPAAGGAGPLPGRAAICAAADAVVSKQP